MILFVRVERCVVVIVINYLFVSEKARSDEGKSNIIITTKKQKYNIRHVNPSAFFFVVLCKGIDAVLFDLLDK